jgi:hypothetical protein
MLLLSSLSACSGLARQGLTGEGASPAPWLVDRGPFPWQGERIEYVVRHAKVEMDLLHAEIEVGQPVEASDGTRCIPLVASAQSVALARVFVRLDDKTYTCLDEKSWEPLYAYKYLDENERQRTYHVFFWPEALYASVERHAGKDVATKDVPLPAHTLDAISWVFMIRQQSPEKGSTSVWYIYDGWIISALTLVSQGPEEIWTPLGIYETTRFDLFREKFDSHWPQGALSGVYLDPELTVDTPKAFMGNVWVTRDQRRIPVRLALETKLGDVELSIRSYVPPAGPATEAD